MRDYAKELNAEQLAVVTAPDGPALVLAGAGSGKTRTIVYRVAYLLERGVAPERILLLTFTNKAAHEMLSRVEELVGNPKLTKKIWGGTFHHIANRLLRTTGSAIGVKPNFTILDREDSKDIIKRVVKEFAHGELKRRLPQPGIFQEVLSYAVNAQVPMEQALERVYAEGMDLIDLFQSVFQRYIEKKKIANALDFDDLLLDWRKLLENAAVKKKLQGFWEHILVDEYQDTNVLQDTIVRTLGEGHRNILVVGDDAQSIYSFRAADIRNIRAFPQSFPDAVVYKLEENYRSTPQILDLANHMIALNVDQFKKTLYTRQDAFTKPEILVAQDPADEAALIADRVMALEDEGVPLKSIAVLFRAAHQSQPLELELNKRRIPYEMRGGLRFFERAHIKDMLAYVRLASNQSDEAAWYRVLGLHEGVGDVTAQKIMSAVRHLADWKTILTTDIGLSVAATKGWNDFRTIMREALGSEKTGPGHMLRRILPFYAVYAKVAYTDFKDRLDDLEQLALFADTYEEIKDFVAETSLQEAFALRGSTDRSREGGVILSTIHQAKGLEWNTVFLMHLTNGSIPHPRAMEEPGGLEEERRLFYVAVTRAQRRLYLIYPLSSSRYTIALHQPSQFLRELDPKHVTGSIESEEETVYVDEDDDGPRSFLPSIDRL